MITRDVLIESTFHAELTGKALLVQSPLNLHYRQPCGFCKAEDAAVHENAVYPPPMRGVFLLGPAEEPNGLKRFGGPEGIRTLDLFHAMEARSQLRHRPTRQGLASILAHRVFL